MAAGRRPGQVGGVRLPFRTVLARRVSLVTVVGQQADHLVQQVPCSPTVQGADRPGVAEAEGERVPGICLPLRGVDFVHHDPHRATGPLEHLGDGEVPVHEPDRHVDHEQDDVRLGDGPLALGTHLRVERITSRLPAAGVDEDE